MTESFKVIFLVCKVNVKFFVVKLGVKYLRMVHSNSMGGDSCFFKCVHLKINTFIKRNPLSILSSAADQKSGCVNMNQSYESENSDLKEGSVNTESQRGV